jgi:hypothetical protein
MKTLMWISFQIVTAGVLWGFFFHVRSPWLLGSAIIATLSAVHMIAKDAATYIKH